MSATGIPNTKSREEVINDILFSVSNNLLGPEEFGKTWELIMKKEIEYNRNLDLYFI
jgi:hypothetical protein